MSIGVRTPRFAQLANDVHAAAPGQHDVDEQDVEGIRRRRVDGVSARSRRWSPRGRPRRGRAGRPPACGGRPRPAGCARASLCVMAAGRPDGLQAFFRYRVRTRPCRIGGVMSPRLPAPRARRPRVGRPATSVALFVVAVAATTVGPAPGGRRRRTANPLTLTLAGAEAQRGPRNPTIVAARLQRPVDVAGINVARNARTRTSRSRRTSQTPRRSIDTFTLPDRAGRQARPPRRSGEAGRHDRRGRAQAHDRRACRTTSGARTSRSSPPMRA